MRGFLARVLPEAGPYSLLALAKGKKPRELNGIESLEALAATLTRLSSQPFDLYYATGAFNERRLAATCRAKRALYLDLDSKDFGSKDRAREDLARFCTAVGMPAPAILVDSGRGIHAYWPLERDLDPPAWDALARELKARCQSAGFPADPSCTADRARVLRVPGTLNHKEETPLPCTMIEDTGEVFDPVMLFRILQGAAPTLPQRAAPAPENDDLSGGMYEKPSFELLESMLPYVKMGSPEDRDRWLGVLQGLHDWDAGGDQGFALADAWSATQPKYKGPEDVRKTWDSLGNYHGRRTTVAAIIKWAKEGGWHAPPPAEHEPAVPLIDFEDQGYRASVAEARPLDERKRDVDARGGRKRLTEIEAIQLLVNEWIFVFEQGKYFSISRRDIYPHAVINEHYDSRMPAANGRAVVATKLLSSSIHTLQVDSLGFHPGEGPTFVEDGRSYANRHAPPAAEIPPTPAELKLILDFLNYLFPREEDQVFRKYYCQFMGHIVQRPGVKIATALLLVGGFGVGKNIAALEIPRRLVGERNTQMVSNKVLRSSFNDQIGRAHLLYFDEVHCNGHWDASDQANGLKSVVSDTTLEVHPKGLAAYNMPNRLVVTASSNYFDAMFLQKLDRRWGVYEVAPTRNYSREQARRYFDVVWKFLKSPRSPGVLRWIFGRVDLAGFNPQNAPPMTTAKERMTDMSDSQEIAAIKEAFRHADAPFDKDLFTLDSVRGMLNAEFGKTYSTHRTGELVRDAIGAQEIGRAMHGTRQLRVWACRNFESWKMKDGKAWAAEL